jgi:hypothetical protein
MLGGPTGIEARNPLAQPSRIEGPPFTPARQNGDEVDHNCVSYPVSPWDTLAFLEPNTSERPNFSDFDASARRFDVKD